MSIQQHTSIVKNLAHHHGFDACGISKAEFLEDQAKTLENWLNQGFHGKMKYMENHFDKRLDPRLLVPGAKSVISLLVNYYPATSSTNDAEFQISKYAIGTDYHLVVKEKLHLLLNDLRATIGEINGRVFVDSAPVMERAWAEKSGLGWIGKNGNLIQKKSGSFYFLCELITDLELIPDHSTTDHCGTCTRCMDACPTQAIVAPGIVDGSSCISYFTIELKEAIPEPMKNHWKNWIFGCDVCQDVCPWNRFSLPNQEKQFNARQPFVDFNKQDWIELTEESFNELFKDSPLERTGYNGMRRNIDFLLKQAHG